MMRITMNPGLLTDRLLELGWDPAHIQIVYDRLIAIAEQDEDYLDISRRLNPAKATRPAWEPGLFSPSKMMR